MSFSATVLTLYPEMFPGPLGISLAGRARDEGKWAIDAVQIRDLPPTSIAPSMTRPQAAARAWC
jgi:tRNA G37 N-methylase TrmD